MKKLILFLLGIYFFSNYSFNRELKCPGSEEFSLSGFMLTANANSENTTPGNSNKVSVIAHFCNDRDETIDLYTHDGMYIGTCRQISKTWGHDCLGTGIIDCIPEWNIEWLLGPCPIVQ